MMCFTLELKIEERATITKHGWSGLEWAVSLPGTVGGAVIGNAGAHGSDVAASLAWVPGWTIQRKNSQAASCWLGLPPVIAREAPKDSGAGWLSRPG